MGGQEIRTGPCGAGRAADTPMVITEDTVEPPGRLRLPYGRGFVKRPGAQPPGSTPRTGRGRGPIGDGQHPSIPFSTFRLEGLLRRGR
jgi:hypothetical protein